MIIVGGEADSMDIVIHLKFSCLVHEKKIKIPWDVKERFIAE